MDWIQKTVSEFGRTMNLDGLTLGDGGRVSLAFEQAGQLSIVRTDRGVLVYLIRPLPHASSETLVKALEFCHFQQRNRFPLHAGLCGVDGLMFLAVVPENEFVLSTLQRVFDMLAECHDRIQQSSASSSSLPHPSAVAGQLK